MSFFSTDCMFSQAETLNWNKGRWFDVRLYHFYRTCIEKVETNLTCTACLWIREGPVCVRDHTSDCVWRNPCWICQMALVTTVNPSSCKYHVMLGLVAAQFNVKLWTHLEGFPTFVIMSSYLHTCTHNCLHLNIAFIGSFSILTWKVYPLPQCKFHPIRDGFGSTLPGLLVPTRSTFMCTKCPQ